MANNWQRWGTASWHNGHHRFLYSFWSQTPLRQIHLKIWGHNSVSKPFRFKANLFDKYREIGFISAFVHQKLKFEFGAWFDRYYCQWSTRSTTVIWANFLVLVTLCNFTLVLLADHRVNYCNKYVLIWQIMTCTFGWFITSTAVWELNGLILILEWFLNFVVNMYGVFGVHDNYQVSNSFL